MPLRPCGSPLYTVVKRTTTGAHREASIPRDTLRAALRLLKAIKRCNRKSIARTGNIEPAKIADLIQEALDDEINRRGLLLALAEYLGSAMEGDVIDLNHWHPLDEHPRAIRR